MTLQHQRKPNALHDLGYKIFLDRYAQKDMTRQTLAVGDIVIVVINSATGQREIGKITAMNLPEITIELNDGEIVTRDLEHVDKPLETDPGQMMDRVAAGIAEIEATPDLRREWTDNFRWLLEDWKFVPGGRILTAAGTDQQLTLFNCFVVPSPRDSREGIMTTLTQMTEIMSRGGGVGINISSLRPRHAYVRGVNGRSSGAVSWGGLYSFVTGLIEQGGCFAGDVRISTDKGLIPAQELVERIEAGESFQADTHQGWRTITDKFRNGVKPVFEVETDRGYRVHITEDHKVAVLMDGQIVTMPLKYLHEGDDILLLMGQGVQGDYISLKPVIYERSIMSTTLNENVRFPAELNEELAYLAGYAYGDGYVHIAKKVTWQAPKALKLATADSHPIIRERLIAAIENIFGLTASIENGDGACKNVTLYSRMVIEWLIQNGLLKQKAENIRVPEAIFRSPSSVQGAFIAGYFDADGCNRGRKGGYGIDSISHGMLQDVQQILAANGILSRIGATDRSEQGWQTIYRLTVVGTNFKQRFAEFVPSAKVTTEANGLRDMNSIYPASVWTSLGARAKYRQRIYDGVSQNISFNQLEKIKTRLIEGGETVLAQKLSETMRVMPDTIRTITPLGEAETFDFEVDDVHLLSGSSVYTSNSRRGALMLILNDWHPDIFNFISSKRTAGQITNANISVGVSDAFMSALKSDGDWTLMFPDTSDPEYNTVWDGDIDKWQALGKKVIHHKTVKAKEVWDAMIESAWASAEPGVWFRERSNKMSNSYYFSNLIATNPCLTGDTRLYTDQGLVTLQELFDEETEFKVAVDGRFGIENHFLPSTRVFMTGVKPVFRLQTREGYSVRATANHRFMTQYGWKELQELKPGDVIHIMNRKGGFGQHGSLELGRVLGWLVGDGTIKEDCAVLSFFGAEKQELAPIFARYVDDIVSPLTSPTATRNSYKVGVLNVGGRDEARVQSKRLHTLVAEYDLVEKKHQVPEVVFKGTEDMQRGFLQALFTADGSIQGSAKKGLSIRLASSVLPLLEQVQMLLSNFGLVSRIYKNRRKEQMRPMPDGKGGYKDYLTKAQHELVLSSTSLVSFMENIGFLMEYKNDAYKKLLSEYVERPYPSLHAANVESVTPDGEEPVYDLTVDRIHANIVNGIVSHNCGEQSLPAWAVCNLGAINLSRFYDQATNDVDWTLLDRTVRYATRFLDNIIDSTPYFFEQNRQTQQDERRVGLGTMGIAELMIKCQVRYGSEESVAFIDKVYKAIACAAYETSAQLAVEKGAFPQFDAEKFVQSGFMQGMPENIIEMVRECGIRNVTLLTQAPTGTTGTMVNASTGVEPFFSWVYYRKSRLGLHEERMPIAQDWYDAHPGETKLPDYFVTAMELAPEDHIKVQAAFQRWVDSSISKTANTPNHYTVEQVGNLYQMMYDLGCKGGTIYRDGSRDEQVLMLKGDERAETEMADLKKKEAAAPAVEEKTEAPATPHRVYSRPTILHGTTVSFKTPFGTSYITMNSDEHNCPFEVFITVGKAGSDVQADAEALGRLISLQLRATAPQNRMDMLKLVIDQLQNIGGARPVGFGQQRVLSLPDAVARALEMHYVTPEEPPHQLTLPGLNGNGKSKAAVQVIEADAIPVAQNGHAHDTPVSMSGADMCPECGTISLVRAEGCRRCLTCDYTEC